MKDYYTYVIIGLLALSLIGTSYIFNFNLLEKAELQFYDTYIVARPIYLSLIIWVVITFITFSTLGLINKFQDNATNWILLASNSLMILLIGFGGYIVYQFFIISALSDFVTNNQQQTLYTEKLNIFWSRLILTSSIFLVVEYLLIGRINKLNGL